MATVLKRGTGDRGAFLDVTMVPDGTFETELDALDAAGTAICGKLVTLTTGANYECTSAAQNAIPHGKVIAFRKTFSGAASSWNLTVRLFAFTDQNSHTYAATCIMQMALDASSTAALGDTVIVYSTDYCEVTDGDTGGFGYIISLNTADTLVDVIF
jgi:hypothetical protein